MTLKQTTFSTEILLDFCCYKKKNTPIAKCQGQTILLHYIKCNLFYLSSLQHEIKSPRMKITVLQASIHYKYVCFNSVLLCIGKGDFLQFDTFYYFSALKNWWAYSWKRLSFFFFLVMKNIVFKLYYFIFLLAYI